MRVELSVKYFDHDDLADLNDWLRAREMRPLEMADLPQIGFLVSEEDLKIAVCFLRQCEGGLGIVDGLCTNPDAPGVLRHVAIDLAVKMVCEEAKQRDITKILAWSRDKGTLTRAYNRHGFEKLPDTLMAKELERPFTTH